MGGRDASDSDGDGGKDVGGCEGNDGDPGSTGDVDGSLLGRIGC